MHTDTPPPHCYPLSPTLACYAVQKNLARVFYYVWFYLIVCLCGTLFLAVGIPLAVALNTVVCLVILGLSPVLAVLAAVAEYLFTLLVFDVNAATDSNFMYTIRLYLWCVWGGVCVKPPSLLGLLNAECAQSSLPPPSPQMSLRLLPQVSPGLAVLCRGVQHP